MRFGPHNYCYESMGIQNAGEFFQYLNSDSQHIVDPVNPVIWFYNKKEYIELFRQELVGKLLSERSAHEYSDDIKAFLKESGVDVGEKLPEQKFNLTSQSTSPSPEAKSAVEKQAVNNPLEAWAEKHVKMAAKRQKIRGVVEAWAEKHVEKQKDVVPAYDTPPNARSALGGNENQPVNVGKNIQEKPIIEKKQNNITALIAQFQGYIDANKASAQHSCLPRKTDFHADRAVRI